MDCSRLPRSSPTPRAYSNSCPSSWWCHPTISSSVVPLTSCLQTFPASGSFPVNHFFTGGQSIGVSASALVLPMNILDWFILGLSGLISLVSKGLSRVFSNTIFKSINSSVLSFLYGPTLISIHDNWKTIALTRLIFVDKVMSLLFSMLSRLVITFLPRSKCLLFSGLQSPSAVILEPRKIKSATLSHCFPIYFPWSDGTGCQLLSQLNANFLSQLFYSLLSLSSRGSLVLLCLLP